MADLLVLTPVPDGEDEWGAHARIREYDATTSTSYPSGGYTITPAMFGLTVIRSIEQLAVSTVGIKLSYVPTIMPSGLSGGKLRVLAANGTELSGTVTAYILRIRIDGE